ncbi:DUF1643 domain-containing protein [Paenibacillus sp. GCM10027627]|uniref:DUF1643 domain-containing protein n=1 Tax=unclassified Paenibacillus TaxID=185978 RepID=UPI003645EBAF
MNKSVYFSSFVDDKKIATNPKTIHNNDEYRYSLTIFFKRKVAGPTAVVIMKNPSKAGIIDETNKKLLSDDTIYHVCDYIFKRQEKFSKLIILNLFPIYGSTFKNIDFKNNIKQLTGKSGEYSRNDKEIETIVDSLTNTDKIILAWGGYPSLGVKKSSKNEEQKLEEQVKEQVKELYAQRIKKVLKIIDGRPTYKVGKGLTNGKFPQHGKMWYDYEELELFSHPTI